MYVKPKNMQFERICKRNLKSLKNIVNYALAKVKIYRYDEVVACGSITLQSKTV